MPGTLSFTIDATIEAVGEACSKITGFLEEAGVGPQTSYSVVLAAEELLTNTVKYGYRDPRGRVMDVAVRVDEGGVFLRFEDEGDPFDPTTAPEPPIGGKIEDLPIGGLGLHIVRKMSRRFEYRRQDGRNVVEIEYAV